MSETDISQLDGAGTKRARALFENAYRYMVARDVDALGALIADDLVFEHMTGLIQDKKEFLTAVADGTVCVYSARHEVIAIEIRGNDGWIMGKTVAEVSSFGAPRHAQNVKLELTIGLNDDNWTISSAKTSSY